MIFLHSDTISHKNGCGHGQKWAWWKMGMASLKLTVFEEWADGIDKLVFCMLHFYTWLQKLKAAPKFLGVDGQKWVWSVWSLGSKRNRWNKFIFACWCKFMKAKSWFNYFWVGVIFCKNQYMNLANFLNAGSDAIIFVRLISYSLNAGGSLQLYFLFLTVFNRM